MRLLLLNQVVWEAVERLDKPLMQSKLETWLVTKTKFVSSLKFPFDIGPLLLRLWRSLWSGSTIMMSMRWRWTTRLRADIWSPALIISLLLILGIWLIR